MRFKLTTLCPLIVFGGLMMILWRGLSLDPRALPSAQLNKRLPSFTAPSLIPYDAALTEHTAKDQVRILSVWASWCATCVQDHTFLMTKQNQVVLLGLNYKDNPKDARAWLRQWGNPYQTVGVDRLGEIGIALGVYGTPETFLIDKAGIIRVRHAGALSENVWQKDFMPFIVKDIDK